MVTSVFGAGLLLGGCLAVVVGLVLTRWSVSGSRTGRWLAIAAWGASILAASMLTLWLANPQSSGVNLDPGETIAQQLRMLRSGRGRGVATFNLIGNVGFLVPFGILARGAVRWGVVSATVAGCLLSAGLELGQYLIGRSADVDDILLNTVGACLGAVLALIVAPGRAKRRREVPTLG